MADVWLCFCAPQGGLKSPPKGSLCEFQQSRLKDHSWSRLLLVCLYKWTGKIKSWTQCSPFNNNEGDFNEKNHDSRKITTLSIEHQNSTAVLKVCFHSDVETEFVILPKMFNLQAQRTCQIVTVKCHCSKGLATGYLPKRQSHRHRNWLGHCCVN